MLEAVPPCESNAQITKSTELGTESRAPGCLLSEERTQRTLRISFLSRSPNARQAAKLRLKSHREPRRDTEAYPTGSNPASDQGPNAGSIVHLFPRSRRRACSTFFRVRSWRLKWRELHSTLHIYVRKEPHVRAQPMVIKKADKISVKPPFIGPAL